jgi:hypothetical protein
MQRVYAGSFDGTQQARCTTGIAVTVWQIKQSRGMLPLSPSGKNTQCRQSLTTCPRALFHFRLPEAKRVPPVFTSERRSGDE